MVSGQAHDRYALYGDPGDRATASLAMVLSLSRWGVLIAALRDSLHCRDGCDLACLVCTPEVRLYAFAGEGADAASSATAEAARSVPQVRLRSSLAGELRSVGNVCRRCVSRVSKACTASASASVRTQAVR